MAHYDCSCMETCPLHHAMQLIGGKWKVTGYKNANGLCTATK